MSNQRQKTQLEESQEKNKLYDEKIERIRAQISTKLGHNMVGSREWMAQVIRSSLNVEPREWQIENSLRLYNSQDVFLTSGTGSGKSTLVHAVISARKLAKKPCRVILIEPTRALSDDQVRYSL